MKKPIKPEIKVEKISLWRKLLKHLKEWGSAASYAINH